MSEAIQPANGTQPTNGSGNGSAQTGTQPGAALPRRQRRDGRPRRTHLPSQPLYGTALDNATNMGTGPMEVVTLPKPIGYAPNPANDTIACMGVEAERNYSTTWTFKGQTQNVKAAFRIPYRFQVKEKGGNVKYWQTEYLLIGYAGGDGPG